MNEKNKTRSIKGIKPDIWFEFAAQAKRNGITQAKLFEKMLLFWLEHQKGVVNVKGNKKASVLSEA